MMELLIRRPDYGYLESALWVPKQFINVEGTKRALTFQLAERKSINILTLYKETEHHLLVPREFWEPKDSPFPVVDCRPRYYQRVDIKSSIQLDHVREGGKLVPTGSNVQQEAMNALLRSRGGILQLACGLGKTVVALDYIARRGVPALIVLDTSQLMEQWTEAINEFLAIPDGVGLIQGENFDWKKPVVLATYHSLAARAFEMTEEVRRWFGTVVWDEAHHVAAPTFARTADLFYGVRLGLTATPDRDDGMHVVYNFHIGPVIYKNLTQALRPRIYFVWTGFGLDPNDPRVKLASEDKNGELHIGKIAGFLGSWGPRIDRVLDEVRRAVSDGRKVLVLSKSVDALVNMLATWNGEPDLFSDIEFPTAADVGETVPPSELDEDGLKQVYRQVHALKARIESNPAKAAVYEAKKAGYEQLLDAHRVFKKCEALWNKQRTEYLTRILSKPSTAGLMIHRIKPAVRTKMLREKQVTFAISKYGREGLDERSLDTIIVNEPLSSRNALQQLMGRVLRPKEGKRDPVVVFLEDDIGPFIGMCQKLRRHLKTWPHDEGGPFKYENIGHAQKGSSPWTTVTAPKTSGSS